MKRIFDFWINVAVGLTVSPIIDIVIQQNNWSLERAYRDMLLFLCGCFIAFFISLIDD